MGQQGAEHASLELEHRVQYKALCGRASRGDRDMASPRAAPQPKEASCCTLL
eukprot:NODE_7544_length_259_cov_204.180952_g6930_i0.p2 GENE.NODE_7544_length_259_cov_204.180952_g6930_i0~~NODE_7544_length_259_cov_204.180952_g6930_i0.p2  ORF type:complete len:61 (-),score=22.20 NODE_7544_length_259_cov_204.180952_g6930_i0:77-232(-)